MKTASRNQVAELVARFATDVDWGALEYDALQGDVIELSREELGRRLTAFLENGCRLFANFVVEWPHPLRIDRGTLPSPAQFIGDDWTAGDEDGRSLALTEVDFSRVAFSCPLRDGEERITGEEKLAREKVEDERYIRLDWGVGAALYGEPDQRMLRFIHDTFGITWMEFSGTVLHDPNGYRHFLCLCCERDGWWDWGIEWLYEGRDADDVSVRLAA